ncbi:MAG TPA: threonine--tRNA ligase [Candidatus Bathyarchaeia archaeon]|nr:threonine--tRNA ligase [Candidatus Bathyarchaeia archaeon]
MRILLIHADHFEYVVKGKAIKEPEELTEEKKSGSADEALVVFCTVEKTDEKDISSTVNSTADSIEDVAKQVKPSKVVLYPYAHLSPSLAAPKAAIALMEGLEIELKGRGYDVLRSPFGWYKSFDIKCKGHPLSELSRSITIEGAAKAAAQKPMPTLYKVLGMDGNTYDPETYQYKAEEDDFRKLVEKEALKKELRGGIPKYLEYCKKFGIEWESLSDVGHMRYEPDGTLIFDLIGEYSWKLANSLGVPVFQLRGTNMFDMAVPAVKQHAELFGDRLYQIEVEGRTLVMRYAACHQQFAIIKDWTISHKNLPFGAFELADSYRLEQSGELLLCFRVRKLHMPDLHVFCKDLEDAKDFSLKVHGKIYEEIIKLDRDYVSIYNTTKSYFEKNTEYFMKLVEVEKKPVLLNFVEEGKFYWVINIEYCIVDELKRPREIATFQIDVGNAQRFNITYTDESGAKKYPAIIHTALIGTVERFIFTVLDTVARQERLGGVPSLPFWLSPTQIRVIPVSKDYLDLASSLMMKVDEAGIRVDLDDRDASVSKKVREAEVAWVPYVVVMGEKEKESGRLTVRERSSGKQRQMDLGELLLEARERLRGYPMKSTTLPKLLSQRPVYKT